MTTVFNQLAGLTGTDDGDGDGAFSQRVVYQAALLSPAVGNQCQLTVMWGAANASTARFLDLTYFGQSSGTRNFTGDQVQVKWGGLSTLNAGPAGSTSVSDVFTLAQPWDNTKDYCFSFDVTSGSTSSLTFFNTGNALFWYIATASGTEAFRTAPTGAWSGPNSSVVFLGKIDITAGAAGPSAGKQASRIFRPQQGPSRGLWTPRSTFIPSGTIATGAGAASGTGAAAATGQGIANSAAASAGTGAAAAIGQGIANSVAASAGIGAAAAVGQGIDNSVAASAGTGTATGVGASTAGAAAASAGVGAATGVGASTLAGDGTASSAGQATVTGVSAALAASVAASAGTGTASGVGAQLGSGAAASAGTGAAAAIGQGLAAGVAASSGVGAALGVGDSMAAGMAVAASAGTSNVLGTGAATWDAVGNAAGTAIVVGASPSTAQPSGGAGYVSTFSRKRWKELQELIAAEKAAAAKARKVGSPARAEALAKASRKAQDAIFALEDVDDRESYERDMERLRAHLATAAAAKKTADSIREAQAAAVLAARMAAEVEDEHELLLLLDD